MTHRAALPPEWTGLGCSGRKTLKRLDIGRIGKDRSGRDRLSKLGRGSLVLVDCSLVDHHQKVFLDWMRWSCFFTILHFLLLFPIPTFCSSHGQTRT
jgi:hypothetical protein